MSNERRIFSRVTFAVPAQLVSLYGNYQVEVHDLSFKGALVSGFEPVTLPLGTQCQLHVTLDGGTEQIDMNMEVAHKEGSHLGLVCRNIDIDSMTHLRRLIELQLGDSDVLERELASLRGPDR